MRIDTRTLRFLRLLLPNGRAERNLQNVYVLQTVERTARLPVEIVEKLVSQGVVAGDGAQCWPNAETGAWCKRQAAGGDFAAQHRILGVNSDAIAVNLGESPLARLATAGKDGSSPFLAPHQVEAGERLRRLIERARLVPRTTMSYDPARTGSKGQAAPADITDFAADARRQLQRISKALPPDCCGVLVDVCGMLKGLQQVETERGWPRRSAKLVLRIGLDQLAEHFGLAAMAQGPAGASVSAWLGERPTRFE